MDHPGCKLGWFDPYIETVSNYQAINMFCQASRKFEWAHHHAVGIDDPSNLTFGAASSHKEISDQRPYSSFRYRAKLDRWREGTNSIYLIWRIKAHNPISHSLPGFDAGGLPR
jgi:hypothetical protein